jgi:hypothetical protein
VQAKAVFREQEMAIDLSTVNWIYVALMAAFVFVAALLGSIISFRNRVGGAVIAAILFAAAFVYWTYYPHPGLPGPTSVGSIVPASSTAPAPAAAAAAPANPVSTISQAPTAPPASDAK